MFLRVPYHSWNLYSSAAKFDLLLVCKHAGTW
uniref:Uncharacterized protein n=1 Tax=Arundo donax TaxID=35708 RepID=A0A0A9H7T7_ARUDO